MKNQKEGGILIPKDPIVKDRVFTALPRFKEWIEQTSLFNTISRFAGTGMEIYGIPNDMKLKLNGTSNVQVAEDLPMELILEFLKNSPFMGSPTVKELNLLDNGNE